MLTDAVLEWLATSEAPNGLLLLAVITRPATWTRLAVSALEDRLGGSEATPQGEATGGE